MPEFESHESYRRFSREVLNTNRYIRSKQTKKFLQALITTAKDRSGLLKEGQGLWRAQIGNDWKPVYQGQGSDAEVVDKAPVPYPDERMKPREKKATEGRANPKGIPNLYLAENKQTAITEVRPWVGARVTVSLFRTTRDVELVDCSQGGFSVYLDGPPPEKRDKVVWQQIDRSFSRPVSKSDDTARYAPTQIIAGLFKREGYDGILYQSSLEDGRNLVLFDIGVAQVDRSELVRVNSVKLNFEPERR
jgi:hypothetical protein